ncbi:TetR/AcrR family transcriptional regulator [Paludibacterium sp.]|uniref:TetR/AcrR family transcriptional regulator n=1 Tax=Paludibacterium sp. TaxID=1917523 RepID=UPI0025F66D1C|nr:TetR/AcrR family transcriptional regulator [Paludibacterium sp.]MBV8646696.1 TetR/AcrR family transcriptional regulator [Paludibacterium sp.]
MRYHPEDKEKTRQRILSVAARRYRAEGLNGVGIANLMADLGMTHGGFYAHFADKEALVSAACDEAFAHLLRRWDERRPAGYTAVVQDYLSREHVNHPDTGCFAAALAGEMARRDTRSRQAFTHGVEQMLHRLAELPGVPPGLPAEAALSMMLGAVILARAVSDRDLSERLCDQVSTVLTGVERDQP